VSQRWLLLGESLICKGMLPCLAPATLSLMVTLETSARLSSDLMYIHIVSCFLSFFSLTNSKTVFPQLCTLIVVQCKPLHFEFVLFISFIVNSHTVNSQQSQQSTVNSHCWYLRVSTQSINSMVVFCMSPKVIYMNWIISPMVSVCGLVSYSTEVDYGESVLCYYS
jgi:hypothetical protein